MNPLKPIRLVAFLIGLSLCLGCQRDDSPNLAPLPLAQMPAVVRQSFEKADGELRAQAENALRDIQTNDLSAAFQDFTELNSKAKLSTEQHTLLARALTTLSQQLAEAAGQGDEQAAETLRQR